MFSKLIIGVAHAKSLVITVWLFTTLRLYNNDKVFRCVPCKRAVLAPRLWLSQVALRPSTFPTCPFIRHCLWSLPQQTIPQPRLPLQTSKEQVQSQSGRNPVWTTPLRQTLQTPDALCLLGASHLWMWTNTAILYDDLHCYYSMTF